MHRERERQTYTHIIAHAALYNCVKMKCVCKHNAFIYACMCVLFFFISRPVRCAMNECV